MEFTEREITMAKNMKDFGLEWNPIFGDWYCSKWRVDLFITWPASRKKFIEYNTWLPLWHQGRQILADNNIIIKLFDLRHHIDDNIEIFCYRIDGRQLRYALGSVKARTDLEGLYQAILLWVLPERKEE